LGTFERRNKISLRMCGKRSKRGEEKYLCVHFAEGEANLVIIAKRDEKEKEEADNFSALCIKLLFMVYKRAALKYIFR